MKRKQTPQQLQIKNLAIVFSLFWKRVNISACFIENQSGTYVFLKVFEKTAEDAEFECSQKIALSSENFFKNSKIGKNNPSANEGNI